MKVTAVRHPASMASDRAEINRYLEKLVGGNCDEAGKNVSDAMAYAVLGSGQRLRPILALRISRLVGTPGAVTIAAAAAVELLHCASLVIDDLPCMDDSPLRRDRPAVHMQFGEATAILAAFGLVALAARSVMEPACEGDNLHRVLAFQLALLRTLDCCGLIAGQALDLERTLAKERAGDCRISDLKTVPLFTLAVQAGSVTAAADANSQALLSGFGRELGLAYQMSDDLLDGEEFDAEPFFEKLGLLRALVAHFGPAGAELDCLVEYLNDRVSAVTACR